MVFTNVISGEQGSHEHYHVPKFQREYIWGKANWEQLMQDIDENPPGYFMGSIICVNEQADPLPGEESIFQVIDGQQRLTTLSLLMAAIYFRLREAKETLGIEDEEEKENYQNTLTSLRNKLIKKVKNTDKGKLGGFADGSKFCFLRVQPSSQNNNLADYKYILSEIGLLEACSRPRYCGLRILFRAYRFFREIVPTDTDKLLDLVLKINQLNFVYISVSSQADAFTLFETLNNRGVPLSPIDIIKNKILAEMERQHEVDIDDSYRRWQKIVSSIPETAAQERFLRHYYNAFRWDKNVRIEGIPRAIRSRIISIYESLIKKDARTVFESLCKQAELYGNLISPETTNFDKQIRDQLVDLERVNAAPVYQILLYLFSRPPESFDEKDFLYRAVDLLRKYYVRRNVTDFPPTRELDQLHMNLVDACQNELDTKKKLGYEFFRKQLLADPDKVVTRSHFENVLRGSMYATNSFMTRYLLITMNELSHTVEYSPDLWKRDDKGRYIWTIEHVLPKTEKISREWVEMIADGDEEKAKILHENHVHELGNLTLSGYNSKLATAAFEKKQSLSEDRKFLGHRINIGYKNGLALNELEFSAEGEKLSLASAKQWRTEMIASRTDSMVNTLLEVFSTDEGAHP